MMDVTVAICTWNRADSLGRTLTSLRAMRVPPDVEWELVVVNNNCTDHTDRVIAEHTRWLPLRGVSEPNQGLSNARNRALMEARGELILYTDDDMDVDPGWLAAYVDAARHWPKAAFFGGSIEPRFETEPPRWITRNLKRLRTVYGIQRHGTEVRPFRCNEEPCGGNMAFRTAILDKQCFQPTLGCTGAQLGDGEESDVVRRLKKAGYRGAWVGTARVTQFIPKERLTRNYIWERFCSQGRARVRIRGRSQYRLLWGVPRYAIRKYIENRLKSWVLSPLKSDRWLNAFATAAKVRGILEEHRNVYRATRAAARAGGLTSPDHLPGC